MAEHLGMQFIYTDYSYTDYSYTDYPSAIDADRCFQEDSVDQLLSAEELAVMPEEWLAALHKAAVLCRDDLLKDLIEQIPSEDGKLRAKLIQLTHAFAFGLISDMAELCLES